MDTHKESVNFDFIECYMSKYTGGEIYISKEFYDEGIAQIIIRHPEKKNAISGKMMVDFRRCIKELEDWENGKGILLYGFGGNFCSGGDLDFARSCNTSTDGFYLSALMLDVLTRLRKLPMLSVAVVDGPTVGGGTEIAIQCDQMLVCDNVKFGFVQGRMGITTAWGATTRLIQLLGERKTTELLLQSKILNAEDCLTIGLANKIISTENRIDDGLTWLRENIIHDKVVIKNYKKIIYQNTIDSCDNSLRLERQLFSELWGGPVNKKALERNIKHITNKI